MIVKKTASVSEIKAGESFSYTFSISNPASTSFANVRASDSLDPFLTHASGSPLTWNFGTLAPGASVSTTFSVLVSSSAPAGTTIKNAVIVGATGIAPINASASDVIVTASPPPNTGGGGNNRGGGSVGTLLRVVTVVTNDNGGKAAPQDFIFSITDSTGKFRGNTPTGGSSQGLAYDFGPGTFTVNPDSRFASTATISLPDTILAIIVSGTDYSFAGFSGDCSAVGVIKLVSGDSKTCTITYNDNASPTPTPAPTGQVKGASTLPATGPLEARYTCDFAPSGTPTGDELVIGRIGVRAPIINPSGNTECDFQKALALGVAKYPSANYFFAHSSDYSWKPGTYKKVFARLPELIPGDTIALGEKEYAVLWTAIVEANDMSVLRQEEAGSLTLQTSYPVGTARQRFIVYARALMP